MSHTPQVEAALTRRSTRPSAAADDTQQLTRAELRRRAQAAATEKKADAAGSRVSAPTVTTPAPMPAAPSRRRTRSAEPAVDPASVEPAVDPASAEPAVDRGSAVVSEGSPVDTARDDAAPLTAVTDSDPLDDVAALADLEPEALTIPDIETTSVAIAIEVPHPVPAADVPVAEASVAVSGEPTPVLLPTSPISLPAPTRRARVRPARTIDGPESFELLTPTDAADAANAPVEAAAAALDEELATPGSSRHEASAAEDARAQEAIDEFEAAARLFAFTGETPVREDAAEEDAAEQDAADRQQVAEHVGRRRLLSVKRVATASFSVGVIGVVGLLAVGMTTPVAAVAVAQGIDLAASTRNVLAASDVSDESEQIQAYVAPADVQNDSVERTEGYAAMTLAEIAAESGIENFSSFYVNDPTAAVQWPFAVGVPITYGFGMRSGTMHEGADFVPGAGAPVQSIADGTVRIATESGGAFGVTVLIDHVIDGELVSSRYAHMQYGSLTVSPGESVTVGTVVGRTGNTGRSFGAHTHFEILASGSTAIDPIEWLREHTGE